MSIDYKELINDIALLVDVGEWDEAGQVIRDTIGREIFEQAQKCETPNGGGLLLALKSYLADGHQVYDGCDELWQVADHLAQFTTVETTLSACVTYREADDTTTTSE